MICVGAVTYCKVESDTRFYENVKQARFPQVVKSNVYHTDEWYDNEVEKIRSSSKAYGYEITPKEEKHLRDTLREIDEDVFIMNEKSKRTNK